MDARERQLIRSVLKQVHPDVLARHPIEQAHNTEALKVVAAKLRCASARDWRQG